MSPPRSNPGYSIVGLASAAICTIANAQVCQPRFTPGFDLSGLDGVVLALHVLDLDGTGPEPPVLIAGGTFQAAWPSQQIRNRIAKWDGVSWQAFGTGLGRDVVDAVMFDDDGPGPHEPELVACGMFDGLGQFGLGFTARWDGTNWQSLNGGMDNLVRGLAVFDEDGPGPAVARLFAGGDFVDAGGVAARGIAAWDGVSWADVGGGVDDHIHDLTVYDADGEGPIPPVLVAVGQFTLAGSVAASNVASWNGAEWSALGAGLDGHVFALHSYDPDGAGPRPPLLVAGGLFSTAGGQPATNIAVWDGSQWNAMGSGVHGEVMVIHEYDPDGSGPAQPDLVVGGLFLSAGAVGASNIAKWNGAVWSPVGEGASSYVSALTVFDVDGSGPEKEKLFVGGRFRLLSGKFAQHVGMWDGDEWSPLGDGMDRGIDDFVVYDFDGRGSQRPSLVAGGSFRTSAGVLTQGLAAWNGERWRPVGQGFGEGNSVKAMATRWHESESTIAPELFVAGRLVDPAGVQHSLMRYSPDRWYSVLPHLTNAAITTMEFFDPDGAGLQPEHLFVAGQFTSIGGISANNIAMFDGASWSPLGMGVSGFGSDVRDLLVHDDGSGEALYVAGNFRDAGGQGGGDLARWRNGEWSNIGLMDGPVNSLVEFDPDGGGPQRTLLVAAGRFHNIGGVYSPRVAMWNGSQWLSMGSGFNGGDVWQTVVIDPDGDGPEPGTLYVAGDFNRTGNGEPISGLARWDGVEWRDMGAGTPDIEVLIAYDDSPSSTGPPSLFAGGSMRHFGVPTSYIGRFGCDFSVCYPDCDQSTGVGVLDIFDFLCFQNSFVAGEPYACECDPDPACNIFDFLCFQTAFVAGCP